MSSHAVQAHNEDHTETDKPASATFFRWLGRMGIMAAILAIVSFLTPGFSIKGFWSFIIAAIVISLLDYLVESFMKVDASPFGKGLKGFILSAIILYVAQFIVPNMHVTILGAILGSLAIGILDALFPTRTM
jgi:uncharacterized membrane protein YvlD (DUF360 family)